MKKRWTRKGLKKELALVLLRNDPKESVPPIYAEAYELLSLASAGLFRPTLAELDSLPDRIVRQWGEINSVRHDVSERNKELDDERAKTKSKS